MHLQQSCPSRHTQAPAASMPMRAYYPSNLLRLNDINQILYSKYENLGITKCKDTLLLNWLGIPGPQVGV